MKNVIVLLIILFPLLNTSHIHSQCDFKDSVSEFTEKYNCSTMPLPFTGVKPDGSDDLFMVSFNCDDKNIYFSFVVFLDENASIEFGDKLIVLFDDGEKIEFKSPIRWDSEITQLGKSISNRLNGIFYIGEPSAGKMATKTIKGFYLENTYAPFEIILDTDSSGSKKGKEDLMNYFKCFYDDKF